MTGLDALLARIDRLQASLSALHGDIAQSSGSRCALEAVESASSHLADAARCLQDEDGDR